MPPIVPGPVAVIIKLVLPQGHIHIDVDQLRSPVGRIGCAFMATLVTDDVHPLLFFAVRL